MIIWGSKSREVTESEGSFFCPECRKQEAPYQIKRADQYFTLYFIPIFKKKELGRFVECKFCKNKFKEEVLNYRPSSAYSSAADENEERQFHSASEMIQMQMTAASISYEEELLKMTQDQEELYLAFELGVIEYFDRVYLSIIKIEDPDLRFFNFLIYYANQKYGENSDRVFQLWKSLAVHGLMHNERKLGFDSVNNQTNPDGSRRASHYPGRYLKKAVGIER